MKDIIIAIIGSGALSALISGCVSMINAKRKSKTGIDKGVQLLLLGELERQTDRYLKNGCISREQWRRYEETYTAYASLGGNGYARGMIENVKRLPMEEC